MARRNPSDGTGCGLADLDATVERILAEPPPGWAGNKGEGDE